MGKKTPYQKQAAKQNKAAQKVDNKPKKKRLLKAVVSLLVVTFVLGAIHFGTYALTTNNPITWNGYTNYLQNVLVLEETVEERDTLQIELTEEQARVTTLQAQKTALEAEVVAKNAALAAKDAQIEANLLLIAAQEQDLLANAASIASLQDANATLEADKANLQAELDALTVNLQTVNEQLSIANATILTLEATIAAKDAEIAALNDYIAILLQATQSTLLLQGQILGTWSSVGYDNNPITIDIYDTNLFPQGFKLTATLKNLGNGNFSIDGEWDGLLTDQLFSSSFFSNLEWNNLTWDFLSNAFYSQNLIQGDIRGWGFATYPQELEQFLNNQSYDQTINVTNQFLNIDLTNNVNIQLPFVLEVTYVEEIQQNSVVVTNMGNTLLDTNELGAAFDVHVQAILDAYTQAAEINISYYLNGAFFHIANATLITEDMIMDYSSLSTNLLALINEAVSVNDGQFFVTVNEQYFNFNLWNDTEWKLGEMLQAVSGIYGSGFSYNFAGFDFQINFVLEIIGEEESQQSSVLLTSAFSLDEISVDPTFDLTLEFEGATYSEDELYNTPNGIMLESHVNLTWNLAGGQWYVSCHISLYQNVGGGVGMLTLSRTSVILRYDHLTSNTYADAVSFAQFATQKIIDEILPNFNYIISVDGQIYIVDILAIMPTFELYLTNVNNSLLSFYQYAESLNFYNPDHSLGQFHNQAFIEGYYDSGLALPFDLMLGGISLLTVYGSYN